MKVRRFDTNVTDRTKERSQLWPCLPEIEDRFGCSLLVDKHVLPVAHAEGIEHRSQGLNGCGEERRGEEEEERRGEERETGTHERIEQLFPEIWSAIISQGKERTVLSLAL